MIDEFKSQLSQGGARNNQFKVDIGGPPFLGISPKTAFSVLCRAASLPGQTITEIPVSFRGRTIYLAGDRTFDDPWTTTFMNESDFKLRNYIETWMNGINDLADGTGEDRLSQYQGNLEVHQLNRDSLNAQDGDILKSYVFKSCWPTSVTAIELAAEQADAIETFEVTWRYEHFAASQLGATRKRPFISVRIGL